MQSQQQENQANRELAAKTPQVGESNRIADQESAIPVKRSSESSLSPAEIESVKQVQAEMRALSPQLPKGVASEMTALLAAVDDHITSDPPNATETAKALTLICNLVEQSMKTSEALQLSEQLHQVLRMLGRTE